VPLLRANQIPTSQRGAGGAASQPRAGGVRIALGAVGGLLVLVAICLAAAEWHAKATIMTDAGHDKASLDQERARLVRRVRLAPHDSSAWLALAEIETRSGAAPDAIAAALKMSYYTGPNEAWLIPFRFGLAASPNLASDADLKTLLETEILTVAQQPATRPLLVQAYRQAQRRLLEFVTTVNAALAAEMQAAVSKP
jgi:hypothetical protein